MKCLSGEFLSQGPLLRRFFISIGQLLTFSAPGRAPVLLSKCISKLSGERPSEDEIVKGFYYFC